MTTLKAYFQPNIGLYLTATIAFLMPVGTKIIPFVIAALCIYRLVQWNWKGYGYWLLRKEVLLFVGFYLLHAIGILWTSNTQAGWFDLQVKLSLLLLPLVMVPAAGYNKGQLELVLRAFVIGCLLASVVVVAIALFNYVNTGRSAVFFYTELSIFMHPGYFAMLLNFAIALLLFYLFSGDSELPHAYIIAAIILLAFVVAMLISRTGIITLLAIFLGAAVYYAYRFKKYIHAVVVLLLSIAAVWGFYNKSEFFQARFERMFEQVSSNQPQKPTGRTAMWTAAFNIIAESPFIGYGTGDVKDVLVPEYEEMGFEKGVSRGLNAHNQFLQTSIALGALGGVVLLLCWLLPFIRSVGFKNYIYTGFLFIVMVNFLTEAILERQVGVMFYAFFNSLLFYNVNQNQLLEE